MLPQCTVVHLPYGRDQEKVQQVLTKYLPRINVKLAHTKVCKTNTEGQKMHKLYGGTRRKNKKKRSRKMLLVEFDRKKL